MCKRYLDQNPIPPDRDSWGVTGPLEQWNEQVLRGILDSAAMSNASRTSNQQIVGDFWSSCIGAGTHEDMALQELRRELNLIDAIGNKSQIAKLTATIHTLIPETWQGELAGTFAPFFGFGASPDFDDATKQLPTMDQGGFSLPARDFYLDTDVKSQKIRASYQAHVAKMLRLAGEASTQASSDAAAVLAIETAMARYAMDEVRRRDPNNLNNKLTLTQVQQLTPDFIWRDYLEGVHAPSSMYYLVTSPQYFRGMQEIIHDSNLAELKTYLRWQLIHHSARWLPSSYAEEDFEFFNKTLNGTSTHPPRWRTCVQAADRFIGDAVAREYIKVAFPESNKSRVMEMVKTIESAMKDDIEGLGWMSPETKKQAEAKLKLILNKVGYPDDWRDYSGLLIRPDDYFGNVQRATSLEFHRQIAKIGQKTDRQDWQLTPPTVDAYYDPQTNTLNFPAGILQPPIFDPEQKQGANYGSAGTLIGHELIHAFDDHGRRFDGEGNLRQWWTANDAANYENRIKCISDEYTQEVPEAGVRQNGLHTREEDTADNGGAHVALLALAATLRDRGKSLDDKEQDGFTALQSFFLSFANSKCEERRAEGVRTWVLSNTHSLNKYRVNNVVANMPEFWRAFSCRKKQRLVHENNSFDRNCRYGETT